MDLVPEFKTLEGLSHPQVAQNEGKQEIWVFYQPASDTGLAFWYHPAYQTGRIMNVL